MELEKTTHIFGGPENLYKSESYFWIWLGDKYIAWGLRAFAQLKKFYFCNAYII